MRETPGWMIHIDKALELGAYITGGVNPELVLADGRRQPITRAKARAAVLQFGEQYPDALPDIESIVDPEETEETVAGGNGRAEPVAEPIDNGTKSEWLRFGEIKQRFGCTNPQASKALDNAATLGIFTRQRGSGPGSHYLYRVDGALVGKVDEIRAKYPDPEAEGDASESGDGYEWVRSRVIAKRYGFDAQDRMAFASRATDGKFVRRKVNGNRYEYRLDETLEDWIEKRKGLTVDRTLSAPPVDPIATSPDPVPDATPAPTPSGRIYGAPVDAADVIAPAPPEGVGVEFDQAGQIQVTGEEPGDAAIGTEPVTEPSDFMRRHAERVASEIAAPDREPTRYGMIDTRDADEAIEAACAVLQPIPDNPFAEGSPMPDPDLVCEIVAIGNIGAALRKVLSNESRTKVLGYILNHFHISKYNLP